MGRSLNEFFNARIRPFGADEYNFLRVDLDKYWDREGLRCPAGFTWLAVYSRQMFSYPHLSAWTKLPAPSAVNFSHIGLQNGSSFTGGGIAFYITTNFRFAATQGLGKSFKVDTHIPPDYATAKHRYCFKINKNNAEFFINGTPRAIILTGLSENIPTWGDVSPYCLGGLTAPLLPSQVTLLESAHTDGSEALFPLDIETEVNSLVCGNGDPLPPRQYALYTENTNTKWNGLSTATVVTSHPIPVWGYSRKTLLFQSSAAGTLAIQVYAGGAWREWASITLVANQLEVYNLNGEIPIARCVYTPVSTDTIAVAEWMLAGD